MDDAGFQSYMQKELEFIARIPDSRSRTFIDLGAGYGRLEDSLSKLAREVVAIELIDDMYQELDKRAERLPNVIATQADITNLEQSLKGFILNEPVFLVLQNTLGVIDGDIQNFLRQLKTYAKANNGEIVLSLFRQEDFENWGSGVYEKAEKMVGKVDFNKSDIKRGLITTNTGYTSKWWTQEDVDKLNQDFEVKDVEVGLGYYLIRLKP